MMKSAPSTYLSATYDRDGFLVTRNVLDSDLIGELRSHLLARREAPQDPARRARTFARQG